MSDFKTVEVVIIEVAIWASICLTSEAVEVATWTHKCPTSICFWNDENPSHLIGQSPWTSDQAVFDVSKTGGLIFKTEFVSIANY